MSPINRRRFLWNGALGLGVLAAPRAGILAEPLGLPIGLELYTVRDQCQKDLEGTLEKVAAIGYREVEVDATVYGKQPSEFRRLLRNNGLVCPSTHHQASTLRAGWDQQIDRARELGASTMVCSYLEPSERKSLDDYRQIAELFNKTGEQCRKAGVQFGYHNHNFEFKEFGGVVAYDELLRRTDPELVRLELDCYWITTAGKDPLDYFNRYPGRFSLLHIKDRKAGHRPTTDSDADSRVFTEVGQGSIDWRRIFAAAPRAGVKHYYVEQDVCERPTLESARMSYEYLKNLKV